MRNDERLIHRVQGGTLTPDCSRLSTWVVCETCCRSLSVWSEWQDFIHVDDHDDDDDDDGRMSEIQVAKRDVQCMKQIQKALNTPHRGTNW